MIALATNARITLYNVGHGLLVLEERCRFWVRPLVFQILEDFLVAILCILGWAQSRPPIRVRQSREVGQLLLRKKDNLKAVQISNLLIRLIRSKKNSFKLDLEGSLTNWNRLIYILHERVDLFLFRLQCIFRNCTSVLSLSDIKWFVRDST